MALMLPPELEIAFQLLGVPWPTEDEDKLRECATAYRTCATALATVVIPTANAGINEVMTNNAGDDIDTLLAYWAEYHPNDKVDDSPHLTSLTISLRALADGHDLAAVLVVAIKLILIFAAFCLAAVLAWAAAAAVISGGMAALHARTATSVWRMFAQRSASTFRRKLEEAFRERLAGGVGTRLRRILDARAPLLPISRRHGDGLDGRLRRFGSDAEGEAYGERLLGHHFTELSRRERLAAENYSRDGRPFNYLLRVPDPQAELDRMLSIPRDRRVLINMFNGVVPSLKDVSDEIAHLQGAVRFPLPERLEALRALNSIDYIKGYDGVDPRSIIGVRHVDQAFTSTSLGTTVVPTTPHPIRYLVHFDIPQKYPCLWLGRRSIHPEQRELVLPPQAEYVFTDAVLKGDGMVHLYARVLPRSAS
ncbi:WXG100-like domain-containing protein [Nonomuraea cavernae]|uniref:Outer membrane channel protein CpnT-like N-terminal domain-containing protein n=1 Tax=Nonomuraea cavernae TaxID=2045107 RepID=A0A918DTR0_9ACTN|nr:hypothetical protein [Nonomuraea cavernae]MCA2189525.1 hypothetical protein [Nonomuraea cavernae]GGO81719.1 hypothetical protein GCM10012289_71340 [Nonomuraea cavernae]